MNVEQEISRLKRNSATAWQRFDFEQSVALLLQAHKLSPKDPRLLLDLGHQSGLRYDYEQAREYLEKAIRLSNWDVNAIMLAGVTCQEFSQPAMARDYYERALKKYPDDARILKSLAEICERLGQLDEAETLTDRAVALCPANKFALALQAKLLRRRKRLAEAEMILRPLAGQPDADVWATALIWYELGLNLDLQARYDEAMAAFVNAKKILRGPTEKAYEEMQETRSRRHAEVQTITADMLKSFLADGKDLPSAQRVAFLVGHPRSGTTLLEQVLDAHPGVVSLEETSIFEHNSLPLFLRTQKWHGGSDWLAKIPPAQLLPARANYFTQAEKFLGQAVGSRLLIDKNPSLTAVVDQIAKLFPETRFIIALRDPRDVCLSCYMQALPPNPLNSAYLDLGRTALEYASVMGVWLALRDKMAAPWQEVRYEDAVNDLESVARRTLVFLDLPWDERVLAFHQHARSKIVRSPTYADVGKPIYKSSLGRWQNYQKYLEPHLAVLEPYLRAFGYA